MNSSSDLPKVNARLSILLSESIEEALGSLLGEPVKQAIYEGLEIQGLRKHQIPEHLPRFDTFLEDTLGTVGRVIERQIAKRLYTQLGLKLVEVQDYALTDYVDMVSRAEQLTN
jgi:hypothetical protein